MAEKAIFQNVIAFAKISSQYQLSATFALTDGNGGSSILSIGVYSSSVNPILPSWKQLLRAEVIYQANLQFGLTVDQVLFLDFTVL